MICAIIDGKELEEVRQQLIKAEQCADLIEWRLDYFEDLELEKLKLLREQVSLPLIFTLRSFLQRGQFKGEEEERLIHLKKLAALKPTFIDVEHTTSPLFIESLKKDHPHLKIILSYHHFEKGMQDPKALLALLQQTPADLYKIALMAETSVDMLRFLLFLRSASQQVIGISMGESGQISRLVAPIFSRPWSYASLEEGSSVAPGLLSVKTLREIYNYQTLSPTTSLYGLIGDPVQQSIGHIVHNKVMHELHLQALYLKMRVSSEELSSWMPLAKQIGFKGLSVTMPLKETIFPYVDVIDPDAQKIGAINTLAFRGERVFGYNTDGRGALRAIEEKKAVKGCRVVLVGAGGAAKAIAYEAIKRGGDVIILNRSIERADRLAQQLGCEAGDLSQMKKEFTKGYEILINCTPEKMPVESCDILSEALVMDLTVRPKETLLLALAKEKGCRVVYGEEMFLYQAIGQLMIWFQGLKDEQLIDIVYSAI